MLANAHFAASTYYSNTQPRSVQVSEEPAVDPSKLAVGGGLTMAVVAVRTVMAAEARLQTMCDGLVCLGLF